MASPKPRLQISLDHEMYVTIKRFARLQNRPMSKVVSEILEAVHDPLQRTVVLLEAAQDAPRQVKEGLRQVVEDLESDLEGEMGSAIKQLDLLLEKAREGANPRPSNTGVR